MLLCRTFIYDLDEIGSVWCTRAIGMNRKGKEKENWTFFLLKKAMGQRYFIIVIYIMRYV